MDDQAKIFDNSVQEVEVDDQAKTRVIIFMRVRGKIKGKLIPSTGKEIHKSEATIKYLE